METNHFELLTSSQVAALLGVTPMTVVRWSDTGRLACEKTAGHHRRFRRDVVEALRRSGHDSEPSAWVNLLRRSVAPAAVEAKLFEEHARLSSWARVADGLGRVLVELGEQWSWGKLSIFEEHVASAQLARGLGRVSEWLPRRPGAPRALLATPEGEQHTLGLSLAELCLREHAWDVVWAGSSTPMEDLLRELQQGGFALLVLSASPALRIGRTLRQQLKALEKACAKTGTELVLGGEGSWPPFSGPVRRFHSFPAFSEYVAELRG